MVEVFKTNVQDKGQAERLVHLLSRYFPACSINFDLGAKAKKTANKLSLF